MSFIHGPLLWGMGLISVPLIIHLLNRRRFVVVRWATMEFLLAARKKNRRRVRLEQLLVLLLRMLAVALIVLAVSRPITSSGALLFLPGARDRVERVVLLDDSGSMAYREGRASAWERARGLLQRLVDDLRQERSGDVLSAWRGTHREHDLLQAPLDSRVDEWLRGLAADGPGEASWDPVSALKELLAQLGKSSDGPAQKVIYILTDLRARDWLGRDGLVPRALGEVILGAPEGTRFLVVDVGSPQLANLGLTVLTPAERLATAGVPLEVTIRVKNHGSDPVRDVPLVLETGQSRVPLPSIAAIPAGEEVEVRHRTTFERAGVHALSVQLPGDALPLDDRRWLALQVSERLKVLLVDGEQGDGPLQDETDMLRLVLSPGEDVVTGVEPVVVTPERIPEDLGPFAAVIACNVERWPPDRLQALERWVERGGGLGLFLGDRLDAAAWERDLWRQGRGLLPCALGERLEAETLDQAPGVLPTEEHHPLTEVFRGDKNPFLRRLRGRIRRACPVDEQVDQGTRVLLRWADAERSPFLLEKDRGKGRVVLFNTTADQAWSPWPKDPSFLITAQELVRLLAPPATAGRNLALGEPLEHGINPARYEPIGELHLPGDEQPRQLHAVPRTGSDALWFSFAETDRAGLVQLDLRPRQGSEAAAQERWAVNVDPSEGETARAEPGRIQPALEGAQLKFLDAGADESLLRATDGSRTELWRSALVAMLLALALEQVLAWRAAHHAPQPAPEDAAPAGATA